MYRITLVLLLLPLFCKSQTRSIKPQLSRNEVGINLGHAVDNAYGVNRVYGDHSLFGQGGYIRSSVKLLTNRGNLQYGLTIEGGTNSNDEWYLSPGFVFNHKFPSRSAYFYAGAMAGYICSDYMMKTPITTGMAHGYAFGVQGGFVQPLGRRVSFTTELAARSTQLWEKVRTYHFLNSVDHGDVISQQKTVIYFPLSLGLRCRF